MRGKDGFVTGICALRLASVAVGVGTSVAGSVVRGGSSGGGVMLVLFILDGGGEVARD